MNGSLFVTFIPLLILVCLGFLIVFVIKRGAESWFRNLKGEEPVNRQSLIEKELAELKWKVEDLETRLDEHIDTEKK